MKKVVTFGEIMLRLTPPGFLRFGQAQSFDIAFGGGEAFVKNLLAPMPWTLIMPTGGVETTRESIEAWFKAGVACVGVGSNLIAKELIAAGDFATIAQKTSAVLAWIDEVRGRSVFGGVEHVGLCPAGKAGGRERKG